MSKNEYELKQEANEKFVEAVKEGQCPGCGVCKGEILVYVGPDRYDHNASAYSTISCRACHGAGTLAGFLDTIPVETLQESVDRRENDSTS